MEFGPVSRPIWHLPPGEQVLMRAKKKEVIAPPMGPVQQEGGGVDVDVAEVGEVAEEVPRVRRQTRTLRSGGRKQIRVAGRIIIAETEGPGRWLGVVPFLVEQFWLNTVEICIYAMGQANHLSVLGFGDRFIWKMISS